MEHKKNNRAFNVIIFLMLIIIVLAGFIVYSFYAKPAFDTYVERRVVSAQTEVVNFMLEQIQNQGFVKITDGEGKEVILVPSFQ